jgi:hypothetical protein
MKKKGGIPRNFPIGRLRLSQHLTESFRHRTGPTIRALPPLLRIHGGQAPRWETSSIDRARETIGARARGPLSEFLAAKSKPQTLTTQSGPQLSTQKLPLDLEQANVSSGSGRTREAEPAKAASEKTAASPLDPALALQHGMNVAKKFIWKRMSPASKAKYLLRKVLGMVHL